MTEPSKDVRADMIRAQDPPAKKVAKKRARKAKPEVREFTHRGVTIKTTSKCRPSHLKTMCVEIRRLMKAGEWTITADVVHISGPDRGRKPK